MFNIPVNVHDGYSKRKLDYEDLFIMCEFDLDFKVYSCYIGIFKIEYNKNVIILLYSTLKALKELNTTSMWGYLYPVSFIKYKRVNLVKCKQLHNLKKSNLVNLLLETT